MIVVRTITSPLTLSVSEQSIKSCRTLVRSPVIRTLFGWRQTSRSPQCLFISKFLNSWLEVASDQVPLNFECRLWSTIGLFDSDLDSERVLNLMELPNMFALLQLIWSHVHELQITGVWSCVQSMSQYLLQITGFMLLLSIYEPMSSCIFSALKSISFMISFFRWI